jgi:hypothetical protein
MMKAASTLPDKDAVGIRRPDMKNMVGTLAGDTGNLAATFTGILAGTMITSSLVAMKMVIIDTAAQSTTVDIRLKSVTMET